MGYKILRAIIPLALFINMLAWGEGAWQVVYPPSPRADKSLVFYDVCFLPLQQGWAVARSPNGIGYIARRDNGVWKSQFHAFQFCPEAIQFLSLKQGWVAGWEQISDEDSEGIMLFTQDGGENWVERHRFPWKIHRMQFVTERDGWAIGAASDADGTPDSVILATTDGGKNWAPQYEGRHEALEYDLCFVDVNNGWALGHSGSWDEVETVLLRTTDGGKNWMRISAQDEIRSLDFINAEVGWAIRQRDISRFHWSILHTQDGGQTWIEQEHCISLDRPAMRFLNENEGWVGLGGGFDVINPEIGRLELDTVICSTRDGGSSWTTYDYGGPERARILNVFQPIDIHFSDNQRGWMAGSGVLVTDDGGITWYWEPHKLFSQESNEIFHNLNDVFFITSEKGWVVGQDGVIFHTDNAGLTWELQESSTGMELLGVHFITSQEGWAVGDEGTILHTIDGGVTWEKQQCKAQMPLNDVQFIDMERGWIAGGESIPEEKGIGTILYTDDGGRKWRPLPDVIDIEPSQITEVQFVDSQTGWITGLGILFHTEDGGESWENFARSGKLTPSSSAYFLDTLTGWGVRDRTILNTTDGGFTWEKQFYFPTTRFHKIYFANHHEGWALSWSGDRIVHTSDGGLNWDVQEPDVYISEMHSICYGGPGVLWAVGDNGTILKYTDPDLRALPPFYWSVKPSGKDISSWGNVKKKGSEILTIQPADGLFQNYPNPFNPETWIPYQLSKNSQVIITVYDATGHTIRTLDLGYREAGYYNTKDKAAYWDGRNDEGEKVASGLYFYHLRTDGFSGMKKMTLTK